MAVSSVTLNRAFTNLAENLRNADQNISRPAVDKLIANIKKGTPGGIELVVSTWEVLPLETRFLILSELITEKAAYAIPVFIKALKDKDNQVRNNAMFGLGQIGQEAKIAVPALVEALGSGDDRNKKFAAEALGKIGPEARAAINPLKALISISTGMLQRSAKRALSKITEKEEEVPDLLLTIRGDYCNQASRDDAARVLAQLATKDITAAHAIKNLLEYRHSGDDRKEGEIRSVAAWALGHVELSQDAKVLLIPPLINALKDQRSYVRHYSIDVLGEIGPEAKLAINSLIGIFSNDEDSQVRKAAREALIKIISKEEAIIPTQARALLKGEVSILEALKTLENEDETVRLCAKGVLKGKDSNAITRELIQGLESDPSTMHAAIRMLGEIGNKEAIVPLCRLLKDPFHGSAVETSLRLIVQQYVRCSNPIVFDEFLKVLKQ